MAIDREKRKQRVPRMSTLPGLDSGLQIPVVHSQKETPLDIAVRKEAREIADFLTHPPSVLPGPARSTSRSRHKGAVKREKPRLRQVSSDDTTRHRRRHASDSPHDHHNHHHHHHQHHRNASGSNRHGRRMKGARSSGRRANVPHSVPWSPYGCHYSPNPKEFPKPKLDSLPPQPLQKGELYYIDLAGNIRKGPVGVGTACYCSPLFRRLESRIDHDRAEISHNLETTKNKLTQRISALELQTRSQLASLDQRLSLWERMRRQGSPLRPHSPSAHISTGRLNEIQTNGTLTRSRSEEKLAQGPTHRPSSTGGLPRAKSSHQVDSSYKNLVVRSTPTSDTGRVLVAGAASKLRQKRSKDHRLKQSALAARSKFMQDFELSSGSDSDGEEDEREEEEVTVRSEKMEDEVDVSRSMTRVEDDGVVMAGEDKYMTVKHKTSPSEKSKRPVEGDQGEENSSPPPVVKATVNFKPGTEIYELRHQDHLVTTYLNRIQTNVRTLREKFEKQLQVSQEDLAPSGELSKAQARVAMVSPQVPLPPAPGAVQVLPQLCSSSSAASSSGIGHSTDTSSGVPKRVLPQKPLLEKDEHNDSGYSITRFNNSPPFTHPGNSNSGSPEVPDQDSNYHSSEENSLTPTEEANRRAVSGKHAAQSTIAPPPHPQPPSWRPPPPVTASSSVPPPSTSTGLWRPQPPDYETATVKRLTKDFLKPHMAVPNQVTQPPSRPPPLTPTYEVYQVYGQNPPVSGYQHGHSMPYTRSSLV
ncbi:unnamed protein product [Notodromas monacha]|uniref:Uncharacterized protein n=1 Tax=Notodromas monacha TaxID=399045 RepID=A0A7R9GAK5_9CRUS|nr:unnamed protein product [Notodromas monacha]CAG0913837.1 unnamed protein product [Notodromas monacha]